MPEYINEDRINEIYTEKFHEIFSVLTEELIKPNAWYLEEPKLLANDIKPTSGIVDISTSLIAKDEPWIQTKKLNEIQVINSMLEAIEIANGIKMVK